MTPTAYDLLELPDQAVHVMAAAAVAFVALQNLLNRGLSHRWIVAAAFGMIHGLGFYAGLHGANMVEAETAPFVLAFNLGVEIAQLAILAAIFALLIWWRERAWYPVLVRAASLLILVVGGYWMIERGIVA